MDPVTCLAAASAAFSTVKRLVEAGREVQDVSMQLGHWFKAASDLKASIEYSENPSVMQKMLSSSESIEQQAINIQLAKEKHREMETQLREMWLYRFGMASYREMIATRRKIAEQREKAIYAKRRRKKAWLEGIIITGVVLSAIGAIILFIWMVKTKGNF